MPWNLPWPFAECAIGVPWLAVGLAMVLPRLVMRYHGACRGWSWCAVRPVMAVGGWLSMANAVGWRGLVRHAIACHGMQWPSRGLPRALPWQYHGMSLQH